MILFSTVGNELFLYIYNFRDVLFEILDSDLSDDMIVDIGMPVTHKNVLYNCRIICFDR